MGADYYLDDNPGARNTVQTECTVTRHVGVAVVRGSAFIFGKVQRSLLCLIFIGWPASYLLISAAVCWLCPGSTVLDVYGQCLRG